MRQQKKTGKRSKLAFENYHRRDAKVRAFLIGMNFTMIVDLSTLIELKNSYIGFYLVIFLM